MMVFCPYCRRRRAEGEIRFRCHADYGCAAVQGGRFSRPAVCVRGHPILDRVCACGERLPTGYASHGGSVVAVVGAVGAGKTTYLTVLVRVMREVVAGRLGVTFGAADDDSDRRYRELENQLYDEGRALPGTQAETRRNPRRPLIFKLERGGRQRRTTFLLFYDTAGDDLEDEAHAQHVAAYLSVARGMIFLVDPSHLDVGTDLADTSRSGRPTGVPGPRDVLEYATRPLPLGRRGMRRRTRIQVPVAVTLTKVDALAESLKRQSAIHRPGSFEHPDPDDRAAVHEQVRALLHRWNSGLEERLSINYETVGYFGVSPLGAALEGGLVPDDGVRPHRVADPLLWILDRIGAIR